MATGLTLAVKIQGVEKFILLWKRKYVFEFSKVTQKYQSGPVTNSHHLDYNTWWTLNDQTASIAQGSEEFFQKRKLKIISDVAISKIYRNDYPIFFAEI